MFWWSIIARAWRSASKRAMTWWLSMPGLMILSATLRRTGSLLLGHVDDAHAPFADLLEQLVRADHRAGPLRDRRFIGRAALFDRWCHRLLHEVAGFVDRLQQAIDFRSQVGVGAAGLVQVSGSFAGRFDLQDSTEDASDVRRRVIHGDSYLHPRRSSWSWGG